MKKEVSKGRQLTAAVLCAIVIFFTVFLVAIVLSGDSEPATGNAQTTAENNNSQQDKVIYIDNNFEITYVDFVDPKSGVTAFNLLLKITNNSNETVIASLTDGYANDTAVTFLTGLPVKVKPEKNAVGAFILGYNNTGITNIDEVKTLEFKVVLYDENFSKKILETKDIMLNLE